MDVQMLTKFFMWCSIINGAFLVLSLFLLTVFQDFIYSVHSKLFPMSRETFKVLIYSFLGGYKILIFVFNLVPYVVLEILG